MKICVVQTRPVKGDVRSNINNHKKLIDLALANGADTIIFPELSVTGYEPELAKELATHPDDSRFDDFQRISDARQVTIGVGVPTVSPDSPCISLVLFGPHQARQTYSKKYLHADEEPFFAVGQGVAGLVSIPDSIALAVCYELSVPEHAEQAARSGAKIYIASVAKSVAGMEKALNRLSEIAATYSMTVLMANCVGYCDNFQCGGKSSAWNNKGELLVQLSDADEGIIIVDTDSQEIITKTI